MHYMSGSGCARWLTRMRFFVPTARLSMSTSPAYSEWLRRINAFIDHQEDVIGAEIGTVREVAGGFQWLILVMTGVAVNPFELRCRRPKQPTQRQ